MEEVEAIRKGQENGMAMKKWFIKKYNIDVGNFFCYPTEIRCNGKLKNGNHFVMSVTVANLRIIPENIPELENKFSTIEKRQELFEWVETHIDILDSGYIEKLPKAYTFLLCTKNTLPKDIKKLIINKLFFLFVFAAQSKKQKLK
jgi:hypothetical protein